MGWNRRRMPGVPLARRRATLLASVGMILALACSSSPEPTTPESTSVDRATAEPTTSAGATSTTGSPDSAAAAVESDDGLVSLSIPAGALPEGVSASEISIEPIALDGFEASEGVEVMAAYKLLPDGLRLSTPATLSLRIGDLSGGVFLFWHLSEDSEDLLAATRGALEDELTVEIEHFSEVVALDVRLIGHSFLDAELELEGGGVQYVNRPFTATATMTREPSDRRILLAPPGGGSVEALLRGEPRLRYLDISARPAVTPAQTFGTGSPLPDPFAVELTCNRAAPFVNITVLAGFEYKVDYARLNANGVLRTREGAVGRASVADLVQIRCVAGEPPPRVTVVSTETPVETPTEEPRTAGNRAPFVSPIRATVLLPVTNYTVAVTDPDNDPLVIQWSGANCGTTTGGETTTMAWTHDGEACDHSTDHQDVTITVLVPDGFWDVRYRYQGATATGMTSCDAAVPTPQ